MQTNPEQWALDLLTDIIDIGGLGGPCSEADCVECGKVALKIQAAFAEREARNLSDTQRLLWRNELGNICPSLDVCFDGSDRVRCGPCAIVAAKAKGVEPDYALPNLPEVSRLKRENARLVGALESAEQAIAEYYRYWTGGETRGSYDGKPERAGLWKAQSQARATLAALKDRTHG